MKTFNKDLRLQIAQIVKDSGEGHIPSSYSIIDVVEFLYGNVLDFDSNNPKWDKRDYFILSKGHGAVALYVVLHKYGFISKVDLELYGRTGGILGGHPDVTIVPGVEASTGSLGHGFPTAVGTALGLKILNSNNRVICLVGDGECHEGTIWESAHVAANLKLGKLCAIVDFNGSASQLMPKDDLEGKWKSFGWKVYSVNGNDPEDLEKVFAELDLKLIGQPTVIIARTIKGKGVSFIEGHGKWHHKIPNDIEMELIKEELD
jgi:transketolase